MVYRGLRKKCPTLSAISTISIAIMIHTKKIIMMSHTLKMIDISFPRLVGQSKERERVDEKKGQENQQREYNRCFQPERQFLHASIIPY